jgi:flagellar assembly protein FliH
MSKAVKFTFDRNFDGANPREVRSEARSRKTYTSEEIELMKHAALEEGRKDGDVRATQAVAASIGQVAAAVHAAIAAMDEEIEIIRAEAAALAVAAAKRLARAALATAPASEIEDTLRLALHQAIGEHRIVVKTSPDVALSLGEQATRIAAEEGFEGRVQFVPDSGLADADCLIEWRGGGFERAQASIEATLDELIARRFARKA